MHSNITNPVEQAHLPLTRTPDQPSVSLDVIMQRKDLLAAINLCIDISGLDDKELYIPLGIDAGHWSNIRKGKAGTHFPTNKLNQLMAMCGNQIPLIWLARVNGFGLHMLESEAERQMRLANERARTWQQKYEVLAEVLQGGRTGPPG